MKDSVHNIAERQRELLGLRKFNFRLIARLMGVLLIYLSLSMALPLLVSLYSRDGAQFALAVSAIMILMLGLFLRNIVGRDAVFELHEQESFWITVAIWVVIPMCGTLPYLFTGGLNSFSDAVFESFSGFTTTGSSVLAHPEELPQGLLIYRAFTQWVGGLGLLLFVVAIFRKLGVGAGQLYDAEFSGAKQRKLHPRLSKSVMRLWRIYAFLTIIMAVALVMLGTDLVNAIALTFSTVSTGGFVTDCQGLSLLGERGLAVVTVFMFLSGINVALLYHFFRFRWRHLVHDEELRVYVVVFLLSVSVCGVSFYAVGNDVGTSVLYSVFHIASTMSTCGFYLPRPDNWPFMASMITFVLIIVGASAGSTGGGIKLRRIMVLIKFVGNYFVRMLHPNAVFRVKMNGEVIQHDYINKIFAFVFLYICFIIGGAFVLTFCGCSIPDAICMAAANVSNLGPSPLINNLGGSLDYSLLPAVGKWTLAVLMLAGRLEIFALLAVFSPAYWKRGR